MSEELQEGASALVPDDEHNRALLANVCPPRWKNPIPKGRYNLVVIGAGTAGLVSAAGAAALGARVALIEKHLMGGDCTNCGCVPSKALIRSARAAHAVRTAGEFGVPAGGGADFGRVMERMRRLRARISAIDSAERFTGLGTDVYLGEACFAGRYEVEVGGARLTFVRAIIATGSRPSILSVPGLARTGYLTNETIFSLKRLPRRLIVIGSGPIGCELAQAFRRFGSEVTIMTDVMGLLPNDDEDAGLVLRRTFEREGIRMVFGARILRAEINGAGKHLIYDCGEGEECAAGDEILLAAGRRPMLDDLHLDAAGVGFDDSGVRVNDRLQTSNPDIFAAGDVCSAYKFTHAAEAMARVALQNALFFGRKRVSALVIPWCTYTDPEVAHIGISAVQAREKGDEVQIFAREMIETDRALLDGETEGFARLYADRRTGRLLGATLVGAHAGESIAEIVLAMTKGMKVSDLVDVIHPYPTQAGAIRRAADLRARSRLKPWIRAMLEQYFSMRR